MKGLKKLANKFDSLSDAEKMDLQVQAHGEVTYEWFLNRPEEIDNLFGCNWFHLQELSVEVGGDKRLRIKGEVISEVPEDESKENLQSASDLIYDYFTLVVKFLENPELIKSGPLNQGDSDEWGTEEFLIGLIEGRRS